jgi:glutamate formiminotransferase/formiminotetrahydrofolate cyclodeaminase
MPEKAKASLLVYRPVASFVQNVASRSPAPGGGSVAALAGALGAALTTMVCRLTIGKKQYASVENDLRKIEEYTKDMRDKFLELVDKDSDAFDAVMDAMRLPDDSTAEKSAKENASREANLRAIQVPLEVMDLAVALLPKTLEVAQKGNVNSISDAGVAGMMLQSALDGAAMNVRINLPNLYDKSKATELKLRMETLLASGKKVADEIQQVVLGKLK